MKLPTITGHSRLAGDTSGDENNLSTLQSSLQSLRTDAVSSNLALGVDVRNVSGDTCIYIN